MLCKGANIKTTNLSRALLPKGTLKSLDTIAKTALTNLFWTGEVCRWWVEAYKGHHSQTNKLKKWMGWNCWLEKEEKGGKLDEEEEGW